MPPTDHNSLIRARFEKQKLPLRQLFACIVTCIVACLSLNSCNYSGNEGEWSTESLDVVDSVRFRETHHFWIGTNFYAVDTLSLLIRPPFEVAENYPTDSLPLIRKGDAVVIEDIVADTANAARPIWLKIAGIEYRGDKQAIKPASGWVLEAQALKRIIPDTPISKIIYILGTSTCRWLLAVISVLLFGTVCVRWRGKYKRKILTTNFYSTPLFMLLSGGVLLHRYIWHYTPETWIEYYFHPTLSPYSPQQPPVINLFLTVFWAIVIVVLAVFEDIRHHSETFGMVCGSFLRTAIEAAVIFAVFAIMLPFQTLLPLTILYWITSIVIYVRHRPRHYYCGKCGAVMTHLGKCEKCGALNK